MEVLIKCAALGVFSSLIALLLRRFHPELSFALTAATLAVILLACGVLLERLLQSVREAVRVFGETPDQLLPVLKCLGIEGAEYEAVRDDGRFHPGRCASVTKDGAELGRFGQIHPDVCEAYGIETEVYGGEFDFELFWKADRKGGRDTPLPKFPAMTRDFAMVVEESVTVGKLEKTIRQSAGELLEDVKLFDVYRGAPVPPGHKSVAFTLSYRAADRTLKEAEVNEINSGVLTALREGYNAILREM